MFILNGKRLSPDSPFRTPDGTQYPNNWLRLASPESREAIGITESVDPPTWYQRFYWGYDADGNLIPKQLEDEEVVEKYTAVDEEDNEVPQTRTYTQTGLKTQYIRQTKETANTLLSPTDWMIIREADNDTPIPTDIKTERQNIRALCNGKIASIAATTDTLELATYITSSEYSSWTTPDPS